MKMSTLIASCTTGKEHPFLRGSEEQRPVGEWVVVRGVEGGTFGVGWGLTAGHHQKWIPEALGEQGTCPSRPLATGTVYRQSLCLRETASPGRSFLQANSTDFFSLKDPLLLWL